MTYVGRTLDSYTLEEEIGSGLYGRVYKAFQGDDPTPLAIKLFHPEVYSSPEDRARFIKEAAELQKVESLNILPLLDFGETDDTVYVVVPFLSGESLAEKVEYHPLSLADTIRILTPIAKALEQIHAYGIVHGNVKPSNILFNEKDEPFLTDFVFTFSSIPPLDVSFQAATSVGYISPEQVRGKSRDHRTDIYSLGCVTYHMLTGQLPFQASTPKGMMFLHSTDMPLSPSDLELELPSAVNNAVMKALSKSPGDRFDSIGSFIGGIKLDDEIALAREPKISFEPPPVPYELESVFEQEVIPGVPELLDIAEERERQKPQLRWLTVIAIIVSCCICGLFLFLNTFRASRNQTPVLQSATTLSADEYFEKGMDALNRENYPLAIENFTKAIELDPNLPEAYIGRGDAFGFGLEEYDRAISDFTRAIALDPSNGIPFSLRGSIYYQQGGYASAINDYQRAILIDPEDFWALNSLAWTLAYNLDARYEEALSYAIRSVEQESNAYNQDTLALVYYKLEKFDQALDHYNIALSLDPNQAISYKYRGDVHLALGDKQAALADYEKYLSFEPVGEERDDAVNKIRELQE